MPQLHQPRQLIRSCISVIGEMVIAQTLSCPEPVQNVSTRKLLHKYVPPPLLQDILNSVVRMIAIHHAPKASAKIISCLLEILLHPRLMELRLSDLSYVGSVELEALDTVEAALIKLLPSMSHLTLLDLSTNRNKITFPSCSTEILKVVGSSCPNLQTLDLNHNNRVTGEGLLYLYPSETQQGCTKLEKLYIQDCSIEPEDVAVLIHFFPNLQIVGYKELGTSLQMLKSQPRKFGWKRKRYQYCLKLTHVDNSLSRVQRCDGEIIDFLCETCPELENLKVRVCDEDVGGMGKLNNLKHLELRFYTGVHHPISLSTINYLIDHGHRLSSLVIFCNRLYAQHIHTIAKNCVNLKKLFLHANTAVMDTELQPKQNMMVKLEVLSLRLGHDELIMSPGACDITFFLVRPAQMLQELYLLVRSLGINHNFMARLLEINSLSKLKILIVDAPRRTLAAPMFELSIDTAYLLINSCPSIHLFGNLICWSVTSAQVAELRKVVRMCNYNLTIIHTQSTKLSKLL